jgi:hypothetical protein
VFQFLFFVLLLARQEPADRESVKVRFGLPGLPRIALEQRDFPPLLPQPHVVAVNELPRALAGGLVILGENINDLQEVAVETDQICPIVFHCGNENNPGRSGRLARRT